MKILKTSILISAAILLIACSGASGSPETASSAANSAANNSTSGAQKNAAVPVEESAAARELYSKNCVNCHKETGEGGAKEVEGKKIKVPSFKDPLLIAETDEEYTEQIEKGGDGMPSYKGKITDEEIKNLVRFIRKEFQGR